VEGESGERVEGESGEGRGRALRSAPTTSTTRTSAPSTCPALAAATRATAAAIETEKYASKDPPALRNRGGGTNKNTPKLGAAGWLARPPVLPVKLKKKGVCFAMESARRGGYSPYRPVFEEMVERGAGGSLRVGAG
jgi:hypothetical protein